MSRSGRSVRYTLVLLVATVLLIMGYAGGRLTDSSGSGSTVSGGARTAYSDTSPEAGFARDMSEHHAQAVEFGMIAHQRASLAQVRSLGGDIALTQQGQVGVMSTWLRSWGLGPTGTRPPMAWMPDGQRALDGNLMPGMASPAQMAALRKATGRQVDILFCEYMVRHHLGGIHMVEAILVSTTDPGVRELAEAMRAGQANEIQILRDLLDLPALRQST